MAGTDEHVETVTRYDYPLSTERPELLCTNGNNKFTDITLANLRAGKLTKQDLRVHPRTLRLQAQIARDAGRPQLADNLCRAAELANVDDDKIIDFYNAMRPSLAKKEQMKDVAKELERRDAPLCAQLVRDAIKVYEERGLFKNEGDGTSSLVHPEGIQR